MFNSVPQRITKNCRFCVCVKRKTDNRYYEKIQDLVFLILTLTKTSLV